LRIYFECQPRWFIVSGPPDWAAVLRASGVPADRLLVESQSQNTYEQAAMLEPLAAQHQIRRLFLVASQLHIRRAAGTFRTRGYDVIPVTSPIDYRPVQGHWRRFVPQKAALALSRAAIYEYAAWSYYRWEGWLAPQQTPILPLPKRPSL
jgi:uncharacterized SAM-binding protein YcdF (DUF218 family)